MAWDVLSGAAKMAWDVLSGVTKTAWDVLSGVTNRCGMFCPRWQKMAWDVLSRDVLSYIRGSRVDLHIGWKSRRLTPKVATIVKYGIRELTYLCPYTMVISLDYLP